jgi:hypothetical protein
MGVGEGRAIAAEMVVGVVCVRRSAALLALVVVVVVGEDMELVLLFALSVAAV